MEQDLKDQVKQSLWQHLHVLTEEIGDRSIYKYHKLKKAADYIISYLSADLPLSQTGILLENA